jgi:hypothetical protein
MSSLKEHAASVSSDAAGPQKHRYLSTKLHDVTSKKNYSYNLRIESADCSGMLVCIYQSTLLHIPEYLSLNISYYGTFTVLTMFYILVVCDVVNVMAA